MEEKDNNQEALNDSTWYVDNYILLRDYYERTISRIAARCVRMGNIAMEEYPFYSYILDVLEEISETGDFIMQHSELHPYVEQKIKGGVEALNKNLKEYKEELQGNASPEMIKEDALEVEKMKKALGSIDKSQDPTIGAGMNVEELVEKLINQDEDARRALEEKNRQLEDNAPQESSLPNDEK